MAVPVLGEGGGFEWVWNLLIRWEFLAPSGGIGRGGRRGMRRVAEVDGTGL